MTIKEQSPQAAGLRRKAKRARELASGALDQLTIERLESFANECETGALASEHEDTKPS